MLSFNDLDVDLQRTVFSAFSILTIFFSLALLSKYVLYVFTGLCFFVTLFFGYKLFIEPKMKGVKK